MGAELGKLGVGRRTLYPSAEIREELCCAVRFARGGVARENYELVGQLMLVCMREGILTGIVRMLRDVIAGHFFSAYHFGADDKLSCGEIASLGASALSYTSNSANCTVL